MKNVQQNAFNRELDWFKANETPEAALLMDNALLKFLVAWKRMLVMRKKRPSVLTKCGRAETWRWLWLNVEFSMEDLACLTGTSVTEAAKKFAMLSGNRMVYPDGTLNTYVDRLLKARTVLLFQKNQPRSRSRQGARENVSKAELAATLRGGGVSPP